MTIPAPSIDATTTALVTAINTQVATLTDGATVLVCEGPPTLYQPDDIITVGEFSDELFSPHALVGSGGAGWLQEDYRIGVKIDIYRGSDSVLLVRQRLSSLIAAVNTAVRTDPSLGGTCYLAYPEQAHRTLEWDPDAKGVRGICEAVIHCQAIN